MLVRGSWLVGLACKFGEEDSRTDRSAPQFFRYLQQRVPNISAVSSVRPEAEGGEAIQRCSEHRAGDAGDGGEDKVVMYLADKVVARHMTEELARARAADDEGGVLAQDGVDAAAGGWA